MNNKKYLWIVYAVLLVVTISGAMAVNQTDLLNGLVRSWAGNYSGSTAIDGTGNTNLTASNSRVFGTAGIIGDGFDFTKGNDNLNMNSKFNLDARSFSFWIKTSQTTDGIILDEARRSSGTNKGVTFSINGISSNKITFHVFGGHNTNFLELTSNVNINNNSWIHVVGTYDGTSSADSGKLYINGVLNTQGTGNIILQGLSTDNFEIGKQSTLTGAPYNGLIDETGIWNRSLTSDEVSALYDIQKDGYTNGTYNFSALNSGGEPVSDSYELNVENNLVGNINNFSILLNGTTYSTTNGSVWISDNFTSGSWDVEVFGMPEGLINKNVTTSFSGLSTSFVVDRKPFIEVYDVDDNLLSNYNLTIGSEVYVVDDDYVFVDETGSNNIVFTKDNWFNATFTETLAYNTEYNLTGLYQGLLDISISQLVTGDTMVYVGLEPNFFDFIIDGVTYSNNVDLPHEMLTGDYEVTMSYVDELLSNNYNTTHEFSINNLNTTELNIKYYDSLINVSAYNAWNNNSINNFTGWIYNEDYDYNETFNTTNGSVLVPAVQGLNYTVFVDGEDYAINNETNYYNITLNASAHNISFGLYTENSIRINAYKEEDGSEITQLINILVSSSDFEQTYNFTNTTTIIEELRDGVYNLRFSSEGFTTRSYSVTVASRSTQELNIYLSNSTSEVTLTVSEEGSDKAIDEARVSMYRFIDDEWVTVESKLTDITGKVLLTYITGERYKFVVSNDDYVSKTFELNPILSSNYNVRLNKKDTFPDISQTFTTSIDFTPRYFVEGNNNITLFFNSPEGRLAEYGFIITYPGGSFEYNNTNAIGETYDHSFNIVGPEFLETVNLTYYYRLVGNEMQYRSFVLPIIDVATPLSFADLRNNDYGLGTFDKLIIMTLTILLVGGLVVLTAGSVSGGAIVILLLAWFGFLGFIPIWSLAILMIAGVTYLMSKGV